MLYGIMSYCAKLTGEDCHIITGPPNRPVLFCSLTSVVVVCNAAGRRAGRPRRRSGGRHSTAGQYGYVPLGVRATPSLNKIEPVRHCQPACCRTLPVLDALYN